MKIRHRTISYLVKKYLRSQKGIAMYPDELREYINSHNGKLTSQQANFILDVRNNPQLNHITYNCYTNSYDMWDYTGNYYHFTMK